MGLDMYTTLNTLISAFLYTILIGGVLLITASCFRKLWLIIVTRRRLYLGQRGKQNADGLSEHLDVLIAVTLNGKITVTAFTAASALVLLLTLTVGLYNLMFIQAILISLISSISPYMALRVRAWSLSRRGSQEGERLTAAILNQYRIEKYNIYETLEKVIASGDDIKVCRTCLYRLLLGIRNTGNKEKIRKSTDIFARTINTNWSRMLAYNIRMAAESGMNVSLGIEDVLLQLREARAIFEERKRLNAESGRIVVFLIPILYIGSIFLSVRFIGISLSGFVKNQFGTPEGFMLFFLVAFLFIGNLVLIEAVISQKMDF